MKSSSSSTSSYSKPYAGCSASICKQEIDHRSTKRSPVLTCAFSDLRNNLSSVMTSFGNVLFIFHKKMQYNYYCVTFVRIVASNLAALYHSWLHLCNRSSESNWLVLQLAISCSLLTTLLFCRCMFYFFIFRISENQSYRCKHVKIQIIFLLRLMSHDIWRRSPTIVKQFFKFGRISPL